MAGKKIIGCLSLQGAFLEHKQVLERMGYEAIRTRTIEDLERIDGLIIPGGESTTIGRLLNDFGLTETLQRRIAEGMPVFGTCAGMIILADHVEGNDQFTLKQMDMEVRRNAFGRQVDSFETDLAIKGIDHPVRGVFIRAPYATRVWGRAEVLSEFDGKIVMVRQEKLLAAAFHPELTDDTSVHEYFLSLV